MEMRILNTKEQVVKHFIPSWCESGERNCEKDLLCNTHEISPNSTPPLTALQARVDKIILKLNPANFNVIFDIVE